MAKPSVGDQMTTTKIHLGGGVYAEFDGYHIVLTTGYPLVSSNTNPSPANRIHLTPPAIEVLIEYRNTLQREIKSE